MVKELEMLWQERDLETWGLKLAPSANHNGGRHSEPIPNFGIGVKRRPLAACQPLGPAATGSPITCPTNTPSR